MFGETDVFLVMGRRGSGKSFLSQKIIDCYPRRIILDPMSEYGSSDESCHYTFDSFGQALLEVSRRGDKEFEIIYRFSPEAQDNEETFNELCRVAWYRGGVLVVIEEVQRFTTPHSIPPWLFECLFTGRHQNLALLFTTQRPGNCNKNIISQANHIFCGQLHEENDVTYVQAVVGRDRARTLKTLPLRRFLYFQPGIEKTVFVDNDLV